MIVQNLRTFITCVLSKMNASILEVLHKMGGSGWSILPTVENAGIVVANGQAVLRRALPSLCYWGWELYLSHTAA